jgi:peptidoglycan/xylan/chitin deacetylase (PgdA/CDA1 family)
VHSVFAAAVVGGCANLMGAVALALVILGSVIMAYYGVPAIFALLAKRRLGLRARRAGAVVLTFDDGPGERLTLAVLSVLRENGVKASFFLLGRNIPGRERIVRQIAQEGHDVYSHGYDHVDHWRAAPLHALADIKAGWRELDTALGREGGTYPFRPPCGRLNLFSLLYLLWKKAPIYLWTVDSGDTWTCAELPPADWSAREVAARRGGVVLYHDFDRRRSWVEEYVLGSLEAVLRGTNGRMLLCRPMSSLWNNRWEEGGSRHGENEDNDATTHG